MGRPLTVWCLLWALTGGCGDADDVVGDDIFDQLQAVSGITAVIERPAVNSPGYRFFEMTLEQPVENGSSDLFLQYLTLLYTGADRPVVLNTTGYHHYMGDRLSEPAALLGANQITVEHRFFVTSRPDPVDWSKLDIARAADDFHLVVELLRPLFGDGVWIGSGVSKGGMTSIYHRRFYPDDVDATIAYVAPLSHGLADPRYLSFFDTVGPEACRQQVRDVQRLTLEHRDAMVDLALEDGYEFEILGAERAVELAIAEEEWSFWQYLGVWWCDYYLPDPLTADEQDLYFFLSFANSPANYADNDILLFQPYYYQAATELGYPALADDHLSDLLEYDADDVSLLMPADSSPEFDAGAMDDIAAWLDGSAERVMLIYGEWDPWTAGAMDLGSSPDAYTFVAPQADHSASISWLAEPDQTEALSILEQWSGVAPNTTRAAAYPRPALRELPALRR